LFFFNIRTQTKDVEERVLGDIFVPDGREVTADWKKILLNEKLFNFFKY